MNIKFNSRKIADNCTLIAYFLILIISFFGILAIADLIFHWDILSDRIERLAYLFIWASIVIIIGSFLISLMVNMNSMSRSLENIDSTLKNRIGDEDN